MTYRPNTKQWKPGDLVIHDVGPRSAEMLMRVVSINEGTGWVEVAYVDRQMQAVLWEGFGLETDEFAPEELHDPALWGIPLGLTPDDPRYDVECRLVGTEVTQ